MLREVHRLCPSISRACTGVSKLYFTLRTCPPSIFKAAQRAFDEALRSSLERIVTASGPGFGDWQWRLATLPFAFGGLGVYSAGDVRHYAFLASRLQSAGLQTKLLRHTGNPSEVAAPILMKKLADVYFTKVTASAESTFSLSPRQSALWKSQQGDHTSAWLRAVPILGLGQTMNAKTYRCVLCYRLGVPLFSISTACSACSRVFTRDIFGDHAVSCAVWSSSYAKVIWITCEFRLNDLKDGFFLLLDYVLIFTVTIDDLTFVFMKEKVIFAC
ncbi:uncharacterized protein [Rutidosis leptorrhynchoides]|uniref:uncharacterized protein n=1 Tax=Rutidosis leptorrhynchoides TaxID=125765 RepID=UPI003A998493